MNGYIMTYRALILLFIIYFYHRPLSAVLDGRVAPIYLTTRYTFTNFEWAYGRVYFKQGFDLPINGTAIVDLVEPVDGNIVFKNSTLIMNNNLNITSNATITGTGFINAKGNILKFDASIGLGPSDRFIFTGNIIIEGNGSNYILPNTGAFIFTQKSPSVFLRNIELRLLTSSNFYTAPAAPAALVFQNSRLILLQQLILNADSVRFYDRGNIIRGKKGSELRINGVLYLQSFTDLVVSQGIILSASSLLSSDPTGGITLQSAQLNIINTATSDLLFNRVNSVNNPAGSLYISGKSILKVEYPKEIIVGRFSDIVLFPGSTFDIQPGIKIKIT